MSLNAGDLESLLRLGLVEGVGPRRLRALVERFGGAEAALVAAPAQLRSIPGVGVEVARRIRAATGPAGDRAVRTAMQRLEGLDAVTLTPDDPRYPASFRDIAEPPYLLFAAGDLGLLSRPAVAVVGTRTPTAYGRAAARELSRDLALGGLAVISGMARGIDTAAHEGALEAGGATIGILGHGIEQVYPPESRTLFRQVRQRGLLLTEFVPGEAPRAGNFPRRNRLITALSRAILVVEMGLRSGAQHTVSFGLEQGKEVMAVPGPIGSSASEGTNQLIKDGARMVTRASDLIEELYGVGTDPGLSRPPAAVTAPAPGPTVELDLLNPAEARILHALGAQPTHIDGVATAAGLDVRLTLATLLELELRGLVDALPGKRYHRCHSTR